MAAKDCLKHLEKEIKKEINGTSDYRKDNFSVIKDDYEQYLILGYTCKPSFESGDSVGELIPIYFYLDNQGEIKWRKAHNYTGSEFVKYTYPMGKKIDFESIGYPNKESKVRWFINPFDMPFTSIKSDAFITGVAFGSVLLVTLLMCAAHRAGKRSILLSQKGINADAELGSYVPLSDGTIGKNQA